jgi:UDP-galactopyranose mutase
MYDWLIVGAGYSGAVLAERIATELDQRVLVVDKRGHIAGNAFDYLDEAGVLVHKYGPHFFHTNSPRVFEYLSRFTNWHAYEHRVLAMVDGRLVPVPFNLTSLKMLVPGLKGQRLQEALLSKYGLDTKVPILRMREENTGELRWLADYIYEKVFYGYTTKQWGLTPEQLAPSVTARVPIHVSYDDRYFQDTYQAMPAEGYTSLFARIFDHPNIEVRLNSDYRDVMQHERFNRMIYTGPIDSFFDHAHGELPYRSLRFELDTLNRKKFQEVCQVNFPNDHDYTRITEFKHSTSGLGINASERTTIAREFPQAHVAGSTEPFYPIPKDDYREIAERYKADAAKLNGSVVFCGRLADYQYYNMDQVVARALMVFEQEVATHERVRRVGDVQPKHVAA